MNATLTYSEFLVHDFPPALFTNYTNELVLRDFYSIDKFLVYLKLQTCFILPGFFSAIRTTLNELNT